MWGIKSLLEGFDVVSGLSVNLFKSKVYDVNIHEDFMVLASNFLLCNTDVFLFNFLGLSVDVNHRRIASWRPMVDSLKRKLSS